MFIYLDLSFISFAGYFLGQINFTKSRNTAILLILLAQIITTVVYVNRRQPLITTDQLVAIRSFSPQGTVLAISASDAPWFLGFLPNKNQAVLAPGLFRNPSSYEQWLDFWSGENQF